MSGCCNYDSNIPLSSGEVPDTGWEPCVVTFIRSIIGDLSTTPQYSDERLLELAQVAAYYVATDLACCTSVTKPDIDVCVALASNPLEHPSFTNLMVLKTACLIDQASLRFKAAAEGVRATAGPATLQIMSSSSSYNLLFQQGPCAAYADLKENLCFRCPVQAGRGCGQVLGAYVSACGGAGGYNCVSCGSSSSDCECELSWNQTEW